MDLDADKVTITCHRFNFLGFNIGMYFSEKIMLVLQTSELQELGFRHSKDIARRLGASSIAILDKYRENDIEYVPHERAYWVNEMDLYKK